VRVVCIDGAVTGAVLLVVGVVAPSAGRSTSSSAAPDGTPGPPSVVRGRGRRWIELVVSTVAPVDGVDVVTGVAGAADPTVLAVAPALTSTS